MRNILKKAIKYGLLMGMFFGLFTAIGIAAYFNQQGTVAPFIFAVTFIGGVVGGGVVGAMVAAAMVGCVVGFNYLHHRRLQPADVPHVNPYAHLPPIMVVGDTNEDVERQAREEEPNDVPLITEALSTDAEQVILSIPLDDERQDERPAL